MATCPSCRTRYPDDAKTCTVDGAALLPDQACVGAESDMLAGQKIGEYVVEAKLGEGGFGSVYRAVHPLIGKTAAIKVLNRQYSSNPQMVSRFIAEARSVNQIKNRFIIDIFAFGSLEDGRQYYVMELLDGMPMDVYLKERGRLTPEDAIPILRGIAKALDAAHANGVAHRDLKPENVFIVIDEDGTTSPKLLDFGIAKLLGESAAQHKTRTGTPMGTPSYMSPEQCRGKNVDHRTDLYSLGVLAHECLTGKLPFDGDDVMEILFKQINAEAPRMSATCPAVPASLDAPVLQMLEKDASKRPASASDAIDELAVASNAAGFAVSLPQRGISARRPSGQGAPSGVKSTPNLTPAQLDELAAARTVMQATPEHKTLMASESEVKPVLSSRTLRYAIIAVACIGGIGLGVVMTRRGASSVRAEPGAPPSASVEQRVAATAEATPTPMVAPGASVASGSSAAPAAPKEIELDIRANAPKFDVFDGETKIGSGPGVVKLSPRDEPFKLSIRAPGFKPGEVTAAGTKSEVLDVELVKAVAGPVPGKKPHGDLEF